METVHALTQRTDKTALRRAIEINIYGVGLAAFWTTLNTLLLPGRISDVVPDALRGSGLGLISFLGIGVAALVQPVAGHLSDFAPLPDRRRPFIWGGTALMVLWLAVFWAVPTFWLLVLAYILVQIASNGAQVAFQALIPDLVSKENRGLASGMKNALNVLGIALGLLVVQLVQKLTGSDTLSVVYLALVLVVTAVLTKWWVPPVPPLPEDRRPESIRALFDLGRLARSFVETFRAHARFAHAVLAQFLFLLGVYPLQRFLLYLPEDRYHIENAVEQAAGVLVVAIVLGIGAAIGAGSFMAVIWALLSDDIPEGQGAQFYGLANLAVAGSSALAGAWGPLIDAAGRFLPGDAYGISFTIATVISLTSLFPLRWLAARQEEKN